MSSNVQNNQDIVDCWIRCCEWDFGIIKVSRLLLLRVGRGRGRCRCRLYRAAVRRELTGHFGVAIMYCSQNASSCYFVEEQTKRLVVLEINGVLHSSMLALSPQSHRNLPFFSLFSAFFPLLIFLPTFSPSLACIPLHVLCVKFASRLFEDSLCCSRLPQPKIRYASRDVSLQTMAG